MSNEISTLPQNADAMLTFSPSGGFATSLDLKSERGKELYVIAMNGSPDRLADIIGTTIDVTDAIAHQVVLAPKEDGEIVTAVRLVVFDADGEAWQCVSQGAFESLRRLTILYGPLPWPKGVPLTVSQKSIGKKRMFYFDIPRRGVGVADDKKKAEKAK